MSAAAAIAGLGITEMGKVYGRTATDFAAEAIALALDDAGLQAIRLDGLLINGNHSTEMVPTLQFSLGLTDLTLLSAMNAFGSTATMMLQYAAHAIDCGQASVVACVVRRRAAHERAIDLAVGVQRQALRRPWLRRPEVRLRRLRPGQHDVRARPAAAHAPVRDRPRSARCDRRRPSARGRR